MEPAAAAEHHAEPAEHEEEVEEAAEGAAVADGPPAKKQRGDKVQQAQRRLDKYSCLRVTKLCVHAETSAVHCSPICGVGVGGE